MAKREEKQIEILTEDWIGVNKFEDRDAWTAWITWRKTQLGCAQEPENVTVPSYFPPSTISAAREYIAVLKSIRSAVNWRDSSAKLPTDVSAYMG